MKGRTDTPEQGARTVGEVDRLLGESRREVTEGTPQVSVPRRLVARGLPTVTALIVAGVIIGCGGTDYCEHYDDWITAEGDADRIEMRNSGHEVTWSAADQDRWTDAMLRAAEAVGRMWDAAPPGATRASIRAECL